MTCVCAFSTLGSRYLLFLEGRETCAPSGEVNQAVILWSNGGDVGDVIAAVRSVPLEIKERDEEGDEQSQMVERITLAHALVGPSTKGQEVPSVKLVLPAVFHEPARVEPLRLREPLER